MRHGQAAPERTEPERHNGWFDGRLVALCLGSTLITMAAGFVQVRYGTFPMTSRQVVETVTEPTVLLNLNAWKFFLLGGEMPEFTDVETIVWNLRLPRVFVAVITGATLAVSGAIFQAVTRNELASPFVLGVSSGAGFAVLASLVVFSGLAPYLPFVAAIGGSIAFLIVYAIAWKGGTSPVRLVLAGVIVNMVFQSLQQGLFFFADDLGTVQRGLEWITGSLTGTGWSEVRISLVPAAFAIGLAIAGARQLNVLLLGESTARGLGMRVERVRFLLSGVAILAASAAIAVAGVVSFFGLVVPHIVRTVVGGDYRKLMIGCLFAGPALMAAADVGARLALGGPQVPVGVVTGIIGGPYFLYLMRKRQSMGEL